MKIVENWGKVLRYAWSIRLIILAALLQVAELVVALIPQFWMIPPFLFLALSIITTFAAFIARFVAQKSTGVKEP